MRTSVPLAIAAAALLWARPARALDGDTFVPSGSLWDAQGTLQLTQPSIGFPGAAYAGAGLAWTDDPVVVIHPDDTTESLVHTLLATRAVAGFSLLGRVRFDAALPLYPIADAAGGGGARLGDLRLGAVVPLLAHDTGRPAVALAPSVRLPSGDAEGYTGAGGPGAGLVGAVAGGSETGGWTLNAGFEYAPASSLGTLEVGSALLVGAGLHRSLSELLLVGAEITGRVTTTGGLGGFEENPVEIHGYGQFGGVGPVLVTAGAGTGLVAGVGAPDVRLFLAAGWRGAGRPPVHDRDGDTFPDETDRCPELAEDMDAFEDEDGCPEPDNDRDGVPDTSDPCPRQAEDTDGYLDTDGCPDPDNDGDKVLDGEDRCPLDRGSPATAGCPDLDGDLVPDSRDRCPDQPKDPRADSARSDGCPSRVIVTSERIEILEKIQFATGKAVILPSSYPLLADVAAMLDANPDLLLVEVAGHTDDAGPDRTNLALSQARAESVLAHLVQVGRVDPSRLRARGYGETRPVGDNRTPEGQAANRRVEFVILQR